MVIDYKSEHRQELEEIFYEVYSNEPFGYDWLKPKDIKRYFGDLERTPNFLSFTLVYQNKIVGGCMGSVNNYFKAGKYRIGEIFIHPKYQRKGLGSEFMQDIEQILIKKNIEAIELNTQNNLPMYNFYKKLKYIPCEHIAYMIKSIKKQ